MKHAVLFAALTIATAGTAIAAPVSDADRASSLNYAAAVIRKQANVPARVSDILTLTNVRSHPAENSLVYDYEVKGKLADYQKDMLVATPAQKQEACRDQAIKYAMGQGISYVYRYRSTVDNQVTETSIKPSDCRG